MKTKARKLLPALSLIFVNGGVLLAEEQEAVELEAVEVVGVTPLHGSGVSADKISANVQTVSADQMKKAQTIPVRLYQPLFGQRERQRGAKQSLAAGYLELIHK